MIAADMHEVERLADHLERFAKRAIPYAARASLTSSAFEAREAWTKQLGAELTLRNTWTKRSLRVEKARSLDLRRMEAVVGSTADYMRKQELGGRERKRGKHGVPIPTSVASGEGRGAKPRRRVVRRPNRLASIQLRTVRSIKSRRQRNAATISRAKRAGKKYVFLDLERSKGLFRLAGGKRRPKVDMIWDLSRPAVRVAPNPTLGPALAAVEPLLLRIHLRSLREQVRRNGLFKE